MTAEQLARIDHVFFGYEDHGILTMNIGLDYDGSTHQGFGGYCLDSFDKDEDRRIGTAGGMDYVIQILKCLGANSIDEIKGKMCYAIKDKPGFFGKVIGIKQIPQDGKGIFLIKDWQEKWFPGEADKF